MKDRSAALRLASPVATILDPEERHHVDAAGAGIYATRHYDSLEEVIRELKGRRLSAVLVSVGRCVREQPARMEAVVRDFPRVPTVALLSHTSEASPSTVLALGNCGIRTLIDVRHSAGWHTLRELLGAEATRDIDRAATARLRQDLEGVSDDCWRFFETLFLPDFRVATVRYLARRLQVLPSTLMSRFFRNQLPPPKRYLAYARLVRAARLFENPGMSVADVANHLDYSSPQSFGRHVRTMLGISAATFRRTYDGERMLTRFREELVLPNLAGLRTLHPLLVRPGFPIATTHSRVRVAIH